MQWVLKTKMSKVLWKWNVNILIHYLHMNFMGQSVLTQAPTVQLVGSCCPVSASLLGIQAGYTASCTGGIEA